ncbi:hypothetical protein [Deinococcus sp. 6GRE01]|uniref:hypothetical protein n=1 Tax=Deinococcus sp. 6GRE01 TaxID=2745873 RepID=UPI001E6373BD|nr:hypothetical protein [Deinococcus sp. 6GRE01]MCD0158408.1 hypothetical protein [Deinococcus sp. 6GRE01]
MARYTLIIAGVELNPSVPPDAVSRTGGGRTVRDRVSITGVSLRSLGPVTPTRVAVVSPGPDWVLSEAQIDHLRALERSGAPFSVTLGEGYEVSGTFPACRLDGDATFRPVRSNGWTNYSFTLHLG